MKTDQQNPVWVMPVLLILFYWLSQTGLHATTLSGDTVISPEDQRQLITDWGYDIKEGSKAAGLTPAYAQSLFQTDNMTCLRLAVYGGSVFPAHPASGTIIASYYADTLVAMTNARAARSNVVFFADKKLESPDSFPDWVKDTNGIIPAQYAILLADYLGFMQTNGFTIDILGIDLENQYNEGNITPTKYKDTIDALKVLAQTRGFPMPSRLIGPEDYSPNSSWVSGLITNGWGDRLDIAGTHYYPEWRPITQLQSFITAAGSRPIWQSEVHWDSSTNVITDGEQALATLFDCTDARLTGFAWWEYTRSGIQGGIEQGITSSSVGSRPIGVDDGDGPSASLGTLITRGYRRGTNLFVWALNNTSSNRSSAAFSLDLGSVNGSVNYTQWSTNGSTAGLVATAQSNRFLLTLPAHTITEFSFNYQPPSPLPPDSDGDGLSDAFELANGFNPALSNIVFQWVGAINGGDADSLYQELNWAPLNQTNSALTINQNSPINHDLYCLKGYLGGGGGFGASFNVGTHTFSMQGGTIHAQSNAGIYGSAGGKVRFGGNAIVLLKFLQTIPTEVTGAPQITFYTVNAFLSGAMMNIFSNASPKIIVQNTTIATAQTQFLPALYINGRAAQIADFQWSVVNSSDVQLIRSGDSDGDGASDVWEWQYGFNPGDPSDGSLDPDGDGVPNWLESRLGTSPLAASAAPRLDSPQILSDNRVKLHFGPGGVNVIYNLSWTQSLGQAWSNISTINCGASPVAFYEVVHTNALSKTSFYRLDASYAP